MFLKPLIFLYLLLLIFEGALRKWILPDLATPLLIVRDPLVLLIYGVALLERRFPLNNWVIGAALFAILTSITAMAFGHGSIIVTLYGDRANFLQIPLIFVIGSVLDREDVLRVFSWLLYLTIPMTALLTLQFLSPASAFVNIGVGGEGTASFSGAGGRMRSSGTFSFISGVNAFYSLAAACWAGLVFQRGRFPRWLIVLTGICIVLAIPMSVSRGLLVAVAIIVTGAAFAILLLPGRYRLIPQLLLLGGIVTFGTAQLPVFDEASDAFGARWERATVARGGIMKTMGLRIWTDLTGPFMTLEHAGLLGNGIGAGTQGGAMLLRGQRGFIGGEGEWWRLQWEMGFVLGSLFILYRTWLTARLAMFGLVMLRKANALPWLMFLASAPIVLIGQWGQPTTLGFAIFGAGLVLAGGNDGSIRNKEIEEGTQTLS